MAVNGESRGDFVPRRIVHAGRQIPGRGAEVREHQHNNIVVSVPCQSQFLQNLGKVATDMYAGLRPMYTEYNVGNYYREFALNEDIDDSKISAKLRNGVLELELPKKEQAKPRRIEVRSG